jgi:hypothetical protein
LEIQQAIDHHFDIQQTKAQIRPLKKASSEFNPTFLVKAKNNPYLAKKQ